MTESWSLTTVIAAYGAVVSTLVALWNGWYQWQERGRLRCNFELKYHSALPDALLSLRIANVGSRPITVRYIKARRRGRRPWRRGSVVHRLGEDEHVDPDDPFRTFLRLSTPWSLGNRISVGS